MKLAELPASDRAKLKLLIQARKAQQPKVNTEPVEDDKLVTFDDLLVRPKDKRLGLVKFKPNPVQERYLDQLHAAHPEFDWRNHKYNIRGIREDILKARQQGMSTLLLALYFIDTINNPLTQSIIVAHDAPTTEKLFKIVIRFYDNLPPHKRRPRKYSTKREIEFLDIDSIISVGTAGSKSVGRGGTINNAHLSERAFWADGNTVETGLLESIPDDGNVTRETTANGLNEYFEERLRAANGDSNFTNRFFGWYLDPTYRLEPDADFVPTEDELKLAYTYDLDNAQLAWRRRKARDLKSKFPQEYPANEREAFLTSGNPYFDMEYLSELSGELEKPGHEPMPLDTVKASLLEDAFIVEDNEVMRGFKRLLGECKPRDTTDAITLSVWKLPEDGKEYVLSADTAEGINDKGDHDFDSADVFDAETHEQVAHLHGRWDTHEYGLMLAELGFWYNTALLGIERNNHGHAVINAAMHTAKYPEQKRDETRGLYFHQEYDENKKPTSRRPGWPTTQRTKYFALDSLGTSLYERDMHLNCRHSVRELMTFVKLPGGRAGGEGSTHDDRVTSLAIGSALLKLRPRDKFKGQMGAMKDRLKAVAPQ